MGVRDIEEVCYSKVVIADQEDYSTLSKCHPQEQSSLFSSLPREIRDLIWGFATSPVEDPEHQYATNEYYYRPGHTARHKTCYNLLLTCRRVWLEANAMPMLQAEHAFWFYRAAPDARNPEWMEKLTAKNRMDFGVLKMFVQMFAIEGLSDEKDKLRRYFLDTREAANNFQPKVLHVTVRHTDWWNWEDEQDLEFRDDWLQAMLDTEDLRSTPTLKLELETLDYKVNQLNPIVQRLCGLQSKEFATHLINGEPTITRFVLAGQPKVHAWSGPQDIDGETFDQYEGKSTLNYHVVTLIWNLRFTQIPRAHVPTLRRAPRIGAPQPHPTSGTDFAPPAPRPPSPVQNISAVAKRGAYVNSRLRSSRNDRRGYRHARGLWAKLLWVQKFQDECVHGTARQSFVRQMGPWQVERWSRRWEEQGSLLRFDG